MKWASFVLRLAWRTWPRARRAAVQDEAVDAALRGFRKRRRRGGAAWLYLGRAVADVVRAGLIQRAAHGGPHELVRDVLRDATLAGRRLRRAPGHTVAVVLILALGVGANAAVY
ncbi:MAG TPA: hypothetical protein VLL48_07100, partial [Longimicrobiales bacterium]|nr:hypothetical protein [Longimicrobiales bacterium]